MVVRDFVEEANEAMTLSELLGSFEKAALRLNFEHFALSFMQARGHVAKPRQPSNKVIALNYPPDWVERYMALGYGEMDPVVRHGLHAIVPYRWSEVPRCTDQELLILQEAQEAGLRQGLCMPIHEQCGGVFLSTLATTRHEPIPPDTFVLMQVLSVVFHARYSALLSEPLTIPADVYLTTRERECLEWVARGKSSWDISRLLSVSEHTVNFHLKNSMRKLGVGSRVTAAVRATLLGLIPQP